MHVRRGRRDATGGGQLPNNAQVEALNLSYWLATGGGIMRPMDEHTMRLGSELQAAREGLRPRVTQAQAAQKLGVSRTTIQNFEAGKFNKVTPSIREYARLVGLTDGAVDQLAAGDSPTETHDQPKAVPSEPPEAAPQYGTLGLPPAVEYELHAGQTLESTVINLGPDEDDGHLIVVLQGKKDSSPEEIAKIAARYRKARSFLQGLAADEGVADA